MATYIPKPTPPDEPVRIQVKEYRIDGDLNGIKVDVEWFVVDEPVFTTFWTVGLDFIPDVNVVYEWSKDMAPRLLT